MTLSDQMTWRHSSVIPCWVPQTSESVLPAFDVCYSSLSTGRRVKRGEKHTPGLPRVLLMHTNIQRSRKKQNIPVQYFLQVRQLTLCCLVWLQALRLPYTVPSGGSNFCYRIHCSLPSGPSAPGKALSKRTCTPKAYLPVRSTIPRYTV